MSVPLAAQTTTLAEAARNSRPPAVARRAGHVRHLDLADLPLPARAARAQAVEMCRRCGLGELAERAALVVSELVTNALDHAAGDLDRAAVTLTASRTGLLIEVVDADPAPPAMCEPGPWDESGRGIALVSTHSTDWGWRPDPASGGKAVWAWLSGPRDSGRRRGHPADRRAPRGRRGSA